MLKKTLPLLVLSLFVSASIFALPVHAKTDEDTLSMLVFEIPPWSFQNDAGQWDGFGVELVRTLLEKAGFRLSFQTLPWSRALEYMKSGNLDIMVQLSKTPEREEFIHFLGVSAYDQVCLVVRKENAGIELKTLDDMIKNDYLWGIRDKSFYSREFNARLENDTVFSAHFERITKFAINIDRVIAGRIIGLLGDCAGVHYRINTDPRCADLRVLTVPFFKPAPVYFGVSKQLSAEKRDRLQKAYDELAGRGVFKAIVKKWLSAP